MKKPKYKMRFINPNIHLVKLSPKTKKLIFQEIKQVGKHPEACKRIMQAIESMNPYPYISSKLFNNFQRR